MNIKDIKNSLLFLALLSFNSIIFADALKPALVETTIFPEHTEVKISLNIEAVISEINTNLQNTFGTQNEDLYVQLRSLTPLQLRKRFEKYQDTFLNNISLGINGKKADLSLKYIEIPDVGYIKRSRTSILKYSVKTKNIDTLSWEYGKKYGNSAFRFRFFTEGEYTWNTWQITQDKIEIDTAQFKPLSIGENLLKFVQTGFKHVIPLGFDHILFIIAMALSTIGFTKKHFIRIITLVSSFTLAHTITLGLASANIIVVNPAIVEVLIALSIALMAIGNLFLTYHHTREVLLVFMFGLLHGVGFATMLKTFITDSFATSLIGFNIGVELAQICVVIAALTTIFIINKTPIKQKIITNIINIGIAIIATSMILERI